jgi:hypothetical protein
MYSNMVLLNASIELKCILITIKEGIGNVKTTNTTNISLLDFHIALLKVASIVYSILTLQGSQKNNIIMS